MTSPSMPPSSSTEPPLPRNTFAVLFFYVALASLVIVGLSVSFSYYRLLTPSLAAPSQGAPVRSFVTALDSVVPFLHAGDTILIHPPWRTDVVAALEALPNLPPQVRITPVFNPTYQKSNPNELPEHLVVLADIHNADLPYGLVRRVDTPSVTLVDEIAVYTHNLDKTAGKAGKTDPLWSLWQNHDAWRVRLLDGQTESPAEPSAELPAKPSVNTPTDKQQPAGVICDYRPTTNKNMGKFACTAAPWLYIGPTNINVAQRQMRCLWAHPPKTGSLSVEITLDEATKQKYPNVVFNLALSDQAATNKEGGTVVAHVKTLDANRTILQTQDVTRRDQIGFAQSMPFALDKAALLAIDFAVEGSDAQRHLCWTIEEP